MDTSPYQSLKITIVSLAELSKDAIHIHVGLIVFITCMWLLRKRRSLAIPCLAACLFAIGLEILDMRDDLMSVGYWRWKASLHDIANTSFWPIALFLFLKFSPPFKAIWNDQNDKLD